MGRWGVGRWFKALGSGGVEVVFGRTALASEEVPYGCCPKRGEFRQI